MIRFTLSSRHRIPMNSSSLVEKQQKARNQTSMNVSPFTFRCVISSSFSFTWGAHYLRWLLATSMCMCVASNGWKIPEKKKKNEMEKNWKEERRLSKEWASFEYIFAKKRHCTPTDIHLSRKQFEMSSTPPLTQSNSSSSNFRVNYSDYVAE